MENKELSLETRADVLVYNSPEEQVFITEMANISTPGILLKSGTVAIRMFSVDGGKTVTAFVLQENLDSFTVVLPAVLTTDSVTNSVDGAFISPTPIVRLFKSKLSLLAMPTPLICFHYLNVAKAKFNTVPGYFNAERKSQVDMLIGQLGEQLGLERKGSTGPKKKSQKQAEDNMGSQLEPLGPVPEGEELRFFVKPTSKLKH